MSSLPLIVDLDGTLIFTDMLHESALKVFGNNPLATLRIPYWLSRGKAVLKECLAHRVEIDSSTLPYNYVLLDWLKQQHEQGRKLILCTASHITIATAISNHLGIFDEVMASDGNINLSGERKAKTLEERFGKAGFDYVGNSSADLAVWKCARRAIVVNASADVSQKASQYCEVEQTFPSPIRTLKTCGRVLRVHQWLKNLLLFIPLFAAHQLTNSGAWFALILAFFSFSLCASSVYITNDLLDLENDRQHPRKRKRPFASGVVPIWTGVILAPILLFLSFWLATIVGSTFVKCLAFYFVLTCAYSWGLKRLILVDCITLAILYTVRVIAGAGAANMSLSFWLLAFCGFLFLSLAFVKRYAELELQLHKGKQKVNGRGYYTTDAPLIQTLGIASGFATAVVLALYLNSEAVLKLYQTAELVWGAVPILLFWISWMWMQAHRGNMHDDPLVFAVKDKASVLAGILFSMVLVMGATGWPW